MRKVRGPYPEFKDPDERLANQLRHLDMWSMPIIAAMWWDHARAPREIRERALLWNVVELDFHSAKYVADSKRDITRGGRLEAADAKLLFAATSTVTQVAPFQGRARRRAQHLAYNTDARFAQTISAADADEPIYQRWHEWLRMEPAKPRIDFEVACLFIKPITERLTRDGQGKEEFLASLPWPEWPKPRGHPAGD